MGAARVSSPPPERRHPLLAVRSGGERAPGRAGLAPLRRELRRLEHDARTGTSPATPAILIAVMGIAAWSLVALVIATDLLLARLLA